MGAADKPWSLTSESVFLSFQTNEKNGLSEDGAIAAIERFGKNVLQAEKKSNPIILILKHFNNPMVYTLLFAALIACLLQEWINAGAIIGILLLNAIISYTQEMKSNAAIDALKKLSVPKTRVIRDGKIQSIASQDVVPGDVIIFEAGDFVSADARVVEGFQLTADESLLTGESMPVNKISQVIKEDSLLADRKNMLHSGTAISSGSGKAIVTATGMLSEIGQIAGLLNQTMTEETPLQLRLALVTKRLIMLGVVVIFIVIFLRYMEGESWFVILMSAISLAVAAIPEGLPTIVTLALTLAVRRMTSRNAIVRNLSAVETLGSTDVICTDKTGTLTTGIMTVQEKFIPDISHESDFMRALILCNNASMDHGGTGDTTELALLQYASLKQVPIERLREENKRAHEWSFDSDRKRMSVGIAHAQGIEILAKGAPESIVERCGLDEKKMQEIRTKVLELSSKGMRLLAVAKKLMPSIEGNPDVETDLTFLGLIALADPPKPETIPAIKLCRAAGIKVIMITGDHPSTAKAIALELGIAIPGEFEEVMTGKELEAFSSDELQRRVESTAVYARVSPAHKLKIIDALQKNNHVVAMTGDGVNDAPALKKAQIGVAMGKAGTVVARQSSSIILTDDNFSTIVSAVEEGRAIYGNIKRTIQYLLSTNLSEILIVLGSSIFSMPIPFTPIGLLWINLVTDGFPALALAAEPLDKNILVESPKPSPKSFFDTHFLTELFFIGTVMTILCLGVYYYMLETSDLLTAKSYAFALLVYMCLFRSFSCRSETRIFFQLKINYFHIGSIIIPILLQIGLERVGFFQKIFGIIPLDFNEHLLLFLISILPVTFVEIYKLLKKSRKKN